MHELTPALSTVTASFLASFVEVVEAFTIVLAVGVTRSWRPALTVACRRTAGCDGPQSRPPNYPIPFKQS
ncbi:hypothetical protein EOD23_19380 [Mesorhizobium sp. USDA-HM6]|nr:hypothetical protein EOD23_19380 [Mesorhizobium sp. USDA-HM6]